MSLTCAKEKKNESTSTHRSFSPKLQNKGTLTIFAYVQQFLFKSLFKIQLLFWIKYNQLSNSYSTSFHLFHLDSLHFIHISCLSVCYSTTLAYTIRSPPFVFRSFDLARIYEYHSYIIRKLKASSVSMPVPPRNSHRGQHILCCRG